MAVFRKTAIKWFRVLYRPGGAQGHWTYGWLFPSDSLVRANETIDQVCRRKDEGRWTYRVEQIDPRDFDYPKDEKSRQKPRAHVRNTG